MRIFCVRDRQDLKSLSQVSGSVLEMQFTLFLKKMLWIPTFFSGATQNPAVLRDGFGKRRGGRGEEFRPERKMSYLSDSLVENFFPPLPHVHPVAKRNARIPNSKLKVPHFRSSGFFIMHVLVIYPWQMSHPAKQVS